LRLAACDDTVVVFFILQTIDFLEAFRLTLIGRKLYHQKSLQTIEKAKCAVGVQLAKSIVNGLVH